MGVVADILAGVVAGGVVATAGYKIARDFPVEWRWHVEWMVTPSRIAFGVVVGYIARDILGDRDFSGVPAIQIVVFVGLAIFAIQPVASLIGELAVRHGQSDNSKP